MRKKLVSLLTATLMLLGAIKAPALFSKSLDVYAEEPAASNSDLVVMVYARDAIPTGTINYIAT